MSDEKDARGYLQALASKMTEELENLKVMGVPGDDPVSIAIILLLPLFLPIECKLSVSHAHSLYL